MLVFLALGAFLLHEATCHQIASITINEAGAKIGEAAAEASAVAVAAPPPQPIGPQGEAKNLQGILQDQIIQACRPDDKWCAEAAAENKTREKFLEDKIGKICAATPGIPGCEHESEKTRIKKWTDDWWFQTFQKEFNKYPSPGGSAGGAAYAPLQLKETIVNTGEKRVGGGDTPLQRGSQGGVDALFVIPAGKQQQ